MNIMRKLLKGNKGQTALEYALVIAVVASVIVGAAVMIFSGDGGVKDKVFGKAINQVSDTLDSTQNVMNDGG